METRFIEGGEYVDRQTYIQTRDENTKLKATIEHIRAKANKQAEDWGLWFETKTTSEAYLQQELRSLHAAIEQQE